MPEVRPVTIQNEGLRRIYEDAVQRLETIQDASRRQVVRAQMDASFLAVDTALTAMPEAERNATVNRMTETYSACIRQRDPAAAGRLDGANAFDRFIQSFMQDTAPTPAPAPAPSITTPAPAPSTTTSTPNPFGNMTWGRGLGMGAGAAVGWLLGSMFGPGSWLSTVVSVLFAAGGAFAGASWFGDTIDGWLGTGRPGDRNSNAPGTAPTPEGPPGRDITSRDAQELHEAAERYWAERRRESEYARGRDDDDRGRRHDRHERRERRHEPSPGYRY